MPVVSRSFETILLSPRTAKLISTVDVLVVGGGPAGLGAAIGAAKAGAKVVLAERYGFLGGNSTAGLVLSWASYYTSHFSKIKESQRIHLFPTVHGAGKPIIAGVLAQLVEKLTEAGGAMGPSQETGYVLTINPEIFKNVALEMLESLGVELFFHAFASGIVLDNGVWGVVFETKSGPVVIKANIVIDCTGDGDIAAFAGAQFEVGREKDGLVQPMTLMFIIDGFIREHFEEYIKKNPSEWNGVQGLRSLMKEASLEGKFAFPREDILFFGTSNETKVNVNSSRVANVLGTDTWDLTSAELRGRAQIVQLTNFLRKYVPGFEKASIDQSGIMACVRETRRIIGEYKLTAEDVLEAHKFSDVIAHGSYPIDIHNPKGAGTVLKRLKMDESYDIPMRCLLPLRIENMLVAGRCISGTHEAHASYRIMPICMATGHAAGVCGAIASKKKTVPRKVSVELVQRELNRQGAKLKLD